VHLYAATTGLNINSLKQTLASGTSERYVVDSTYPGGSDSLFGGEGDDTLMGAGGNDELQGGSGSDTYVFNLGDGYDEIVEDATDIAATDTLQLGAGLLASETSMLKLGQNLILSWGGNDTLVFVDQFLPLSHSQIERVVFADGTVWDSQWLTAKTLGARFGTTGSDTLIGVQTDDVFMGAEGNDYMEGGMGNDTLLGGDGNDVLDEDGYAVKLGYGDDLLDGGAGNDTLFSGDGNDTLLGGMGNDVMYGEEGNDTLSGGSGNDTLTGGTGNDHFVFDALTLSSGNTDIITDFSTNQNDKIVLSGDVFTSLFGKIDLSANIRNYSAPSVGSDDYIVYDNTTGNVYYDPTGLSNASAVLIATLQNKPLTMTANQYAVI
jgi:Ca2+-binding RTX toxin-like protein